MSTGTLNYDGKRGPINVTWNDPAMQREIEEQKRRAEVGSRINVPAKIAPNTMNVLKHQIVESVDKDGIETKERRTTITERENH